MGRFGVKKAREFALLASQHVRWTELVRQVTPALPLTP